MIAIIDYGLGNPLSIKNMLHRLGTDSVITKDISILQSADKLILPGVGHFAKGMENLKENGLKEILDELVLNDKKPILGICLGMQLMTKHSEEGHVDGLAWVDAQTIKFKADSQDIKIPHMGWSDTFFNSNFIQTAHFVETPPRFYYVHSYYISCENHQEVLCQANYANRDFDSGFIKDNIMGVQFHPEKSHVFGKEFLKQFLNWQP